MQLLYILGRQPAIGLAELESLYGSDQVQQIGEHALVDTDIAVPFSRIGSSIKAAQVEAFIDDTDWKKIQKHLEKVVSTRLSSLPSEGKIKLGLSVYGFSISAQRINATGLTLKKVLKSKNRSVRLVPNNEPTLNSAQVYHNKLTGDLGWEIVILKDHTKSIIAFTSDVQDINSYTLRDRSRPKRDSRVGMLPPKLAQTIINLGAAFTLPSNKMSVLDPFCGTGVILQEAILMGYTAIGTDLEKRMVDYSEQNIEWIKNRLPESFIGSLDYLEAGDATTHSWRNAQDIHFIACETYLGRPFTTSPDSTILHKNRQDCDTIIRKFLENICDQIQPGTRLCLAVPAWFVGSQIYHLKTLDYLEEIGYNRISFVHADEKDLIYHREDQIVGRELVVITRK